MSLNTTTTLTNQYQGYFSKKLLEHAIQELRLNEFAQMGELPKNVGSLIVSYFRRVQSASSNVQTLVEGTPISVFTDLSYAKISVTLAQIGEAVKLTDILSYTDLFDSLKQGVGLMGEDCALKADDITRNVVVAGVGVTSTLKTKRYAQGLANWAAVAAATPLASKFVRTDGLDAATRLKINRAPKIGGYYVGIVPPQVSRDLMNDDDWLKASQYSAVQQLFKGEVGMLDGVRYVEATNPFTEATNGAEGTFAAGGGIFASIITGMGAYGVTKLAGDSPMSPKIIITDKADKSDPLNQTIIAGWKAFYNSVLLNEAWACVIRSQTAMVG